MDRNGVDWSSLQQTYEESGVSLKHLPIIDVDPEDLADKIADAAKALKNLTAGGRKVYIHCTAGRNRSPNVLMYYLWRYEQMDLRDAMNLVKERRRRVNVFENAFEIVGY